METFGLLTFLRDAGVNKHGKRLWQLKCACGQETVAIATAVRNGHTKSCGCQKRKGNRKTHGQRRSRIYAIWCNMKARCDNSAHKSYHNYGARGISYAPQWADFEVFLRDVGAPPTPKHTLDRIDNDGSYEPNNVQWALRQVQSRNTRQNFWVEIDGETRCMHDWCAIYGISGPAVYRRLASGEDIVSAITRPKAARFRKGVDGGVSS